MRFLREVMDVVGGGQPGLVAGRDGETAIHSALLQRALERHHQPARLPDDGDRPGFAALRPVVGHGDHPRHPAEITETVGARHGKAGLLDGRRKLRRTGERGGIGRFAETGGDHGGATGARRRPVAQCLADDAGRHHDQQMIRFFRQSGEIRIAAYAEYFVARRVHRIDRAGIGKTAAGFATTAAASCPACRTRRPARHFGRSAALRLSGCCLLRS